MSAAADRAPVVVLISGRGSNMRELVERSRDPGAGYRVAAVLSDQPDAPGLTAATNFGIPARVLRVPPRALQAPPLALPSPPLALPLPPLALPSPPLALPVPPRALQPLPRGAFDPARAGYEAELAAAIEGYAPSLVVLAGFMRILSPQFVARFEGRILNIHPSLLPKYPGLDTHRRALEAGDAEHGATVHFVTAELDGGPPVIQGKLRVAPKEDALHLAARVHVLEHRIYPLAVQWFATGRLRYADGHAWLDGEVLSRPVACDGIETR